MVELRNAKAHELEALQNFLTTHGANQWNYLPEDGIDQQFQRLYKGTDYCLVAIDGGHPVGIAVYSQPGDIPTLFEPYVAKNPAVYVAEVTVHGEWGGHGIGSTLLNHIAVTSKASGANELILERHEQNLASAGMMRKAGFVEIDCFLDLERRETGSRKTTILSRNLNT
jgi:L-amino acid N-acyltransferase YncA